MRRGSNPSFANPREICEEVKIQAFNVPMQTKEVMTAIISEQFFPSTTLMASTNGALLFAKTSLGTTPIIAMLFIK